MEEKQEKKEKTNIIKTECLINQDTKEKPCTAKQACLDNAVSLCELGPSTAVQRRQESYEKRRESALFQRDVVLEDHKCNNDENLYANKIGNYSKALPHNSLGEVDLNAYRIWIKTLTNGNPEEFESLPMGGSVKFTDPQAAYAYEMTGFDSHHLTIEPPPAFCSAREASEIAEDYWMALTRDVAFIDYDSNPETKAAADDLSMFSDFDGPRYNGKVTTGTLFRGNVTGALKGPFISQLLLKDIPFGARVIDQRYNVPMENIDYMTSFGEWLNIQNGKSPSSAIKLDSIPRYIRDGRALGEYVHRDTSIQAILTACLILLGFGEEAQSLDNPYLFSKTQVGFPTFGAPHVLDFVTRVARMALEAAWYQKFLVHRRLRPEEFGGRVYNYMTNASRYPINSELFDSKVLEHVCRKFHTYLLPIAFPEGCPTHAAYPAGHATFVGAGVTILKAFFNEDYIIPNPVIASRDGLLLLPYLTDGLTVGGELNKLAANIALGRDFAGVHWRSDGSEGMKLGEAVAIGLLQDYRETYNESFKGFSFTKFDGTRVII